MYIVLSKLIQRIRREEDGLALTEYLILLGLLTAGVIAAVLAIGGDLATYWGEWEDFFDTAALGYSS